APEAFLRRPAVTLPFRRGPLPRWVSPPPDARPIFADTRPRPPRGRALAARSPAAPSRTPTSHECGTMTDEFRYLKIERNDGIAVVTANRPEKLNALNAEMIDELDRAFRALAEDADVRGVVVTGAGEKSFVAGADIAELARMGPVDGVQTSRRGQTTFRFIERMSKPVVAAVNGFALGGGLELALACHIRLASENAKFGLPEVKLGIIPGYGGTVRLPRLIGRGRALEMILTGDMIDAQEAYRIGLVNRVCPQAELLAEAERLLRRCIANGPVAIALAIEAVDRTGQMTVDEGLAYESNLFGLLASTEDMREGMNAFLEKRAPNFTGR